MEYMIEVTAVSEDGESAFLGNLLVSASSPAEAEKVAVEALWDDRLTAASCSPVTTLLKSFEEDPDELEIAQEYLGLPRSWWTLEITGYGDFSVYASEKEAEQVCQDKAEWEGGTGTKRPATAEEILEAKREILRKKHKNRVLTLVDIEALRS